MRTVGDEWHPRASVGDLPHVQRRGTDGGGSSVAGDQADGGPGAGAVHAALRFPVPQRSGLWPARCAADEGLSCVRLPGAARPSGPGLPPATNYDPAGVFKTPFAIARDGASPCSLPRARCLPFADTGNRRNRWPVAPGFTFIQLSARALRQGRHVRPL